MYIVIPLTYIINKSLAYEIVPDNMNVARVIPLFKSDDQYLFNNYHHISISVIINFKSLACTANSQDLANGFTCDKTFDGDYRATTGWAPSTPAYIDEWIRWVRADGAEMFIFEIHIKPDASSYQCSEYELRFSSINPIKASINQKRSPRPYHQISQQRYCIIHL